MPVPQYDITENSILEVRLIGTLAGQRTMNVFHYYLQTPGSSYDGPTLAVELVDKLNDTDPTSLMGSIASFCSEDMVFVRWEYQWIYSTRYMAGQIACNITTGEEVGPALPPNLAASITLRSELAAPRRLGRKSFAGVAVASVEDGLIKPADMLQLEALGAVIIADVPGIMGTGVMRPIIWSRAFPAIRTGMTGYVAQNTVRDQRTRTVGQGI